MNDAVPIVEGFTELVEVGRGGFSRVFAAYQAAFDRRVAIKVLNDRLADDASVEAFEWECQAMGALSRHPFIVTVLASAFTSDYRPCIVMDLFEQGNYMQLLHRDGPLPLEELLSLSVRLAGALATAHQDGVIHGDVKPQNIFKSAFGYPALGDFGIARLRNRLAERSGLGLSPHYAAPELTEVGADAAGAAADQYSLAATIYTLATGRRPFESAHRQTPQQVLTQALSAPVPTLPTSFPRDLTAATHRAMAREPQDRFPRPFRSRNRLRQHRTPPRAPSDRYPHRRHRQRRHHRDRRRHPQRAPPTRHRTVPHPPTLAPSPSHLPKNPRPPTNRPPTNPNPGAVVGAAPSSPSPSSSSPAPPPTFSPDPTTPPLQHRHHSHPNPNKRSNLLQGRPWNLRCPRSRPRRPHLLPPPSRLRHRPLPQQVPHHRQSRRRQAMRHLLRRSQT